MVAQRSAYGARFRVKGTAQYVEPVALDLTPGAFAAPESAPYDVAGGLGRRSRTWRTGGWGPNAAIVYSLDELRRKSRDQARKTPYAGAAIDKLTSNIVGTGIVPRSTAARPTAGLSKARAKQVKQEDAAFRAAVQALWLEWTDQADSVGAHDFYGLQALAVRGMVEGGETFTRLRTRLLSDGLPVPLQLQVLEGEHCPHLKTDAPQRIRQGIQYDAIGARVGFWLFREHPGDGIISTQAFEPVLVPAADICHLYRAQRPSQDRGEPWLARALRTLYDFDGYFDAELMRKKNAARLVGFIIKKLEDQSDLPGSGPLGADPPGEDGVGTVEFEPATLQVLADGEDIKFSDPPDVGPNFEIFVREAKRQVAAALGLLYELLSGDYSQLNDRTLRAALNDFRRAVEGWQHHLVVFQFCRPVWNRWFDLALLAGSLKLPAGMTRSQAAAVKWIPQAWPYIHPVQDVQGKAMEVQAGFSSRTQKVAEGGYDAEAIDAENKADNDRADGLGLSYTSDGRRATKLDAPTDDPAPEPATSVPEQS
ncbi:phage portal protein [Methylobacterium sp. 391_Methyba4]|uniref:phage portal protein n=1 Tax=Methylobacterium sp. 391_Methyba4 TaxID=3038924 RepID=UPI00241D6B39|nr:phage portal protein [Methylobacterium sp. 391_Methyba4]WFS07770.1 phage portal protein [Methylobacterium sp. 391_Methyba4]